MISPLPSLSSSSLTTSPHLFCVCLLPLRNGGAVVVLLLNLMMTMKVNRETKAVERAERASLELKGSATDRQPIPTYYV